MTFPDSDVEFSVFSEEAETCLFSFWTSSLSVVFWCSGDESDAAVTLKIRLFLLSADLKKVLHVSWRLVYYKTLQMSRKTSKDSWYKLCRQMLTSRVDDVTATCGYLSACRFHCWFLSFECLDCICDLICFPNLDLALKEAKRNFFFLLNFNRENI